jgi:hypothetical protein
MNTYRLRVQILRFGFDHSWGVPDLDTNGLVSALPGATMREFSDAGNWVATLELDLQRPQHVDALNEILLVLQRAGYTILNGTVTEWVTSAAEGAIAGALGGGLIGTTTRDGLGMLLSTGVLLAGSIVGSNLKRVEKIYQIQPNYLGGLTLVEAPLEGNEQTGSAWVRAHSHSMFPKAGIPLA